MDHPIHRGIYRAPLTSGESPISVIIKLQDSNFIFMTFNDEELCIVKWWVEIKNESELDSWKLQIDQRLTKNSYIIGTSSPNPAVLKNLPVKCLLFHLPISGFNSTLFTFTVMLILPWTQFYPSPNFILILISTSP